MMQKINRSSAYRNFLTVIAIGYILSVSFYMFSHRAWFSPDQFFAVAILAALILGRSKEFLIDWVPAMLLVFGYEYLRGLAPVLNDRVNIHFLKDADVFLFGGNVTIFLQNRLTSPDRLFWYDYVTTLLYISHFFVPWFIGFLFWVKNRQYFRLYVTAFLIVSYAGFVTYMVFPAMPPWMASKEGYLPPLIKIMDRVMASFANPIDVPSLYRFFGANLVAPMPSLHAAYPFLIFLFIRKYFPGYIFLALPYFLGVFFTVVYLGEHYVVDVIAGGLYSLAGFLVIERLQPFFTDKTVPAVTTASPVSKNNKRPPGRARP